MTGSDDTDRPKPHRKAALPQENRESIVNYAEFLAWRERIAARRAFWRTIWIGLVSAGLLNTVIWLAGRVWQFIAEHARWIG